MKYTLTALITFLIASLIYGNLTVDENTIHAVMLTLFVLLAVTVFTDDKGEKLQ